MKNKWKETLTKLKAARWETPMQRPKRFEIVFDAPGKVYFSDQLMTGSVLLEVDEPVNLKGVKMRFKGECCIAFSDRPKIIKKPKKKKKKPPASSPPWSPETSPKTLNTANGQVNGLNNPGFIPDVNEDTDEIDLKEKFKYHNRPKSTDSSWKETTIFGPKFHYEAHETYFDCEFYIYGHKYQKDEKELLPPGLHEFPFAFQLPPNLPPSFSSEKGIIRYLAAAVLDRPTAANLVYKTGFSMHSVLDLNMNSTAGSSISRIKSKNPCGLFCDSGPITLAMRLPRQGYVPGETIFISAEVDNISAKTTHRTRLILIQDIFYKMPNDMKTIKEERVIKEIVRGMIPSGETDFWEKVAISIPPLVTNNVHDTCRLIEVSYRIDMILELPIPWNELQVSIPLVIGSVPHQHLFNSFLPPREIQKDDDAPVIPDLPYDNFPNFSFNDCFFGPEPLELQYYKLTGNDEYLGPQYHPLSMFAPTYITYTPGNNLGMNMFPDCDDDDEEEEKQTTVKSSAKTNGKMSGKSTVSKSTAKNSGKSKN